MLLFAFPYQSPASHRTGCIAGRMARHGFFRSPKALTRAVSGEGRGSTQDAGPQTGGLP